MKTTILFPLLISCCSAFVAYAENNTAQLVVSAKHNANHITENELAETAPKVLAIPVRFACLRYARFPDATILQWRISSRHKPVKSAVLERSTDGTHYRQISKVDDRDGAFTDCDLREFASYRLKFLIGDDTVYSSVVTVSGGAYMAGK